MNELISALTGNPNSIMNFRAIHDTNKTVPAHNFRGTFAECERVLRQYNEAGYGIFAAMQEMDGVGTSIPNVTRIRTQFADIDGNQQGIIAAMQWWLRPTFTVYTSPGKQHFYWNVTPYLDIPYYEDIQRRLITQFGADPSCVDPCRWARLPGFYHRKGEPHLVVMQVLSGVTYNPQVLSAALASVAPHSGGGIGARHELGTPAMAAPSLEWLLFAFSKIDPNELDRHEWVSLMAAFKQAGWTLANEEHLFTLFNQWCSTYDRTDANGVRLVNNVAENRKQWNSIRNTERGWNGIVRRAGILPALLLGNGATAARNDVVPSMAEITTGEFLDAAQQTKYFAGCTLIISEGYIRTPAGYHMDATKFNARFGGPRFVHTIDGKTTDEPWKAATRNQLWRIPMVDRARFLPKYEPNSIHTDEFGRTSVNSYIRPRVEHELGDVTPWVNHVSKLLPIERDREILFDFLTWQVQRVGHKIPWSPLLQSAEGAGKQAFYIVMSHALGGDYVYMPKAEQLADSGGKFNAWMENKLLIVVNEIRVGEKFHLMEVLKPLVEQEEIEIEGKGANQRKGDLPANWFMLSNYRDALVITDNSRRYSPFFSALQSAMQIYAAGMDERYFTAFFEWLKGAGKRYVTHWLLNRQFSPYFSYARAPETSSSREAIQSSKSGVQQLIEDAIAAGEPGFRKGWVSTKAVARLSAEAGIRIETKAMSKTLETLGYYRVGSTWKGVDRGAALWNINPKMLTTFDYDTDQFLQ